MEERASRIQGQDPLQVQIRHRLAAGTPSVASEMNDHQPAPQPAGPARVQPAWWRRLLCCCPRRSARPSGGPDVQAAVPAVADEAGLEMVPAGSG